jgi:hypothetical protein
MAAPTNRPPASTGEMRAYLLKQMIAVAEGKIDHQTAASICKLAQQSYNISKLELRAAEIASRHGNVTIDSWEFRNEPSHTDTSPAEVRPAKAR